MESEWKCGAICQVIKQPNGEQVKNLYSRGKFVRECQSARQYEVVELTTSIRSTAKVYSKSDISKNKLRQKLMAEIRNHKKVRHPHVLQFRHVFEDEENVYLLVEPAVNGTMEQLLGRRCRLSQPQVQYYFNAMVDMLLQLNCRQIIHRDIRLETLYLTNGLTLKLGDFGQSCQHKNERRKSLLKLTHFTSPQVINQSGHSYEADLWSVAAVVYTLLTGQEPFKSGQSFSLGRIRNASFSFPEDLVVDVRWKEILKRMLVADPSKRISLEQLKAMKFPQAPHYLEDSLLFTANRLIAPKADRTSRFQQIFQSNFAQLPLKSRITTVLKTQTFSSEKHRSTEGQARVLSIQQISDEVGLVYVVTGKVACLRFQDGSTLALVRNGCEYHPAFGSVVNLEMEAARKNKNIGKKLTILQHCIEKIGMNGQETNQPSSCPVIVKQYILRDEYIVLKLSNSLCQVFLLSSSHNESMVVDPLTEDYYIDGEYDPIDPKLPLYRFVLQQRKKGTFKFD